MTRTTLLLALALTGCGEAGWESGGAGRWASGPWDPDDVAGIWTLTGDGSREDCRDERYDTDELHLSSLPLHVEQDHDVLTLAEELAGFTFFDGRVDLFGVTFSTRETTDLGLITFRFEGQTHGTRQILGTFDGGGPESCRSRGSFAVYIQPAPE